MIEVNHLTKKYGDHTAVSDLSFSIEKGHIYGFLGPNGAGKSTTMNIMTGCLAATDGEVKIGGYDIFEEPKQAKKLIGYLPEMPPLYVDQTPREYLTFVASAKGIRRADMQDEIDKVIEETHIEDVSEKLIKHLSKGYRQRVGIAQALLGNPEVIILDEPTVGLDPMQIIEIRDLIKELGEKHTVILSSHILSEVQAVCEKVLIIYKGKLVAFDDLENLGRTLESGSTIELSAEASEEEFRDIISGIDSISEVEFVENEVQSFKTDASVYQGSTEATAEATGKATAKATAEATAKATAEATAKASTAKPTVTSATLTLSVKEPEAECRALFFAFAKAGKPIIKMNPVKATLEDIFIELTSQDPADLTGSGNLSGYEEDDDDFTDEEA